MLDRGFLAGTLFYPTMAHDDKVVSLYGQAIDAVFSEIAQAIDKDDISRILKGPAAHTGFKRLL